MIGQEYPKAQYNSSGMGGCVAPDLYYELSMKLLVNCGICPYELVKFYFMNLRSN